MSKDSQEDEKAILAALDGIIRMQQTIRGGLDLCVDTGLVFLRTYYNNLPGQVARIFSLPQNVVRVFERF